MDLSDWEFVDVLTVEQAACLWVGVPPRTPVPLRMSPGEEARIASVLQALSGAIVSGALIADSSKNFRANIGIYRASLVTREALRAFATSKGQRPAFLFDTLMSSADEVAVAVPIEGTDSIEPDKRKGGRPLEYDWDAFMVEIIRVADLDGLPETQAKLISQMLEWCQREWAKEPAESSVKKRISYIYNRLSRGQKPRQL